MRNWPSVEDPPAGRCSIKWSDASEGLAWVEALRTALSKQSDMAAKEVLDDLTALERVLIRAAKENLRFRLALDM